MSELLLAKKRNPELPWAKLFDKAARMDNAAHEAIAIDSKLNVQSFQIAGLLREDYMSQPTRYDLTGPFYLWLRKVVTLDAIEMAKDLQQLNYLLERLDKLDDPILNTTWMDIVETWFAVRELTSAMSGEMTQKVLVCIFSDKNVLRALELAHMMQDIRGGKAPDGLLTIFKKNLGKHMKVGPFVVHRTHTHTHTHPRAPSRTRPCM